VINATTTTTEYTSNGANALTIANGTQQGQMKFVLYIAEDAGGDAGTLSGGNVIGTSVTFTDVGDCCTLMWANGQTKWFPVGGNALFAP